MELTAEADSPIHFDRSRSSEGSIRESPSDSGKVIANQEQHRSLSAEAREIEVDDTNECYRSGMKKLVDASWKYDRDRDGAFIKVTNTISRVKLVANHQNLPLQSIEYLIL
jgi:hypothetical protein